MPLRVHYVIYNKLNSVYTEIDSQVHSQGHCTISAVNIRGYTAGDS